MQDPAPTQTADFPDPPGFDPVPSASMRHDGWTPECQSGFIAMLAATGVVAAAARAVGKSARSAYKLRERSGAESFSAAWDEALMQGWQQSLDTAIERAINGYEVPRLYRGKQVGTVRRYDDRLLIAALSARPPRAERRESMPDAGTFANFANFGNFERLLAMLADPLDPPRPSP